MAQRGLWSIAEKRMLEERGALPKEEGDKGQRIQSPARRQVPSQLAEGG